MDGRGLLRINQYELYETIGVGSYGVVKKCTDMDTLKTYAVKVIPRKQYIEHSEDSVTNKVGIQVEMACLLQL